MNTKTHRDIPTLLQQSRTDEALILARQHLDESPDDAAANYHMGLVNLMMGHLQQAIDYLSRACDKAPHHPVWQCNLGQALFQSGQLDQAHRVISAALALRPDYATAIYNLACIELSLGNHESAQGRFRALLQRDPDHADYRCGLADSLRARGRCRQAVKHYQKALKQMPDHGRAHANLGLLLGHFGQLDDAMQHCQKAVDLMPDHFLPRFNLGRLHVLEDQFDEAMDQFASAWELDDQSSDLCIEIASVWLMVQDYPQATQWFNQALAIDPDCHDAMAGRAQVMLALGESSRALEEIAELALQDDASSRLIRCYADALFDDGDADAALVQMARLTELQPHNPALHSRCGQVHAAAGEMTSAFSAYERALELNPDCIAALQGIAVQQRNKLSGSMVQRIQTLLGKSANRHGRLAALHNALAYYEDGRGDHALAAAHMNHANELQWAWQSGRGWDYDSEQYEQHVSRLIACFDRQYFETLDNNRQGSSLPVFIVGMPRSGTTLTEQILSRHPEAIGIGERQFAQQSFQRVLPADDADAMRSRLSQLDAPALNRLSDQYLKRLKALIPDEASHQISRVVDKMPDNYSLIGWILTLFPNARIIHIRRSLKDVALSCWLTQFGKIQWASRLGDLTHRIAQYQRLMAHYRSCVGDRIHELDYAALVSDPEPTIRELLQALDLQWDQRCLMPQESDRLVRTASIAQVRQPIHSGSLEKWRRYEDHLPDLFNAINDTH